MTKKQKEVLTAMSWDNAVLVVREVCVTCSTVIDLYSVTDYRGKYLKLRQQTFDVLLKRKWISRESEGVYTRTLRGREALKL